MLGVGVTGPVGGEVAAPGQTPSPSDGRPVPGDPNDERDAWAVLASVHGLGPVGLGALLRRYGSGLAILREAAMPGGPGRLADGMGCDTDDDADRDRPVAIDVAKAIAVAAGKAGQILDRIRGLGLQVVTVDSSAYPVRLAAIEMPPHVLYLLGDVAALDGPDAIAIVGTRRATDLGRAFASRLAAQLADLGATIVSGLAVGIDGSAHSAALHAGGKTVAVIGSGHAVLHPRAHSRLAASIVAAGGAVVSELAPDVEPSVGTFPRRNRIISGLADATVVVEAPARSGALITASWALEQGRGCYLVPGAIGAPASAGCLSFLREFPMEARIVAGIPQLIEDLGLAERLTTPGVSVPAAATLAGVSEAAARIGRELVLGRTTVDELAATTGWPIATILAALTLLERRGLAVGVHGRFRPAGGLAAADPDRERTAAAGHR